MSKKTDQAFVAWNNRFKKQCRIFGWKAAAIAALPFPIIGWGFAYWCWHKAGKIHGPDLGDHHGRAGIATSDDLRRVGMRS